jgi:DNA ligase-4
MVDDTSLLSVRHSERLERLKQLVTCIKGRSALVDRWVIDFDKPSAAADLRKIFAICIQDRQEGLVLKADDPYFDFGAGRQRYGSCAIKLKKEYVGKFGEVGDFAVVGARYDAAKAKSYNIPGLKWTHFYIGCLKNAEAVQRWKKPPKFIVTNVVELNATQLNKLRRYLNPEAVSAESEIIPIDFDYIPGIDGGKRPSLIFTEPLVFDIRSFSFDKAGDTGFWGPRFAQVNKIQLDRSCVDVLSFEKLQEMAIAEKEQPPPEDDREIALWVAALKGKGDQDDDDDYDATSQATTSRSSTPSYPSSPCPDVDGGDSSEPDGSPLHPTANPPTHASQNLTESPLGSPQHAPETSEDSTALYNRKRPYHSCASPFLTRKIPRYTLDEVRPDDRDARDSGSPGPLDEVVPIHTCKY